MRQFMFGALCTAAALLAASCNNSPKNRAPEGANDSENAAAVDYFTVRAGPVADARRSALSGNFQMLKVAAANGIPSDGRGGACLAFGAADLGYVKMAAKSCTANSQCYTNEGESAGYCDVQAHSCWAKPAKDEAKLCNRPILMTPTTLNPVPTGPLDAGEWVKPGAKVRVVACLQKTGAIPGPNGTGCPTKDGADRIEVLGPVATVHP